MYKKNPLSIYQEMDNDVAPGAAFEKRWYESVIRSLNNIMNNQLTPLESHKRLIEICDGLEWIQNNLNENLSTQHRELLQKVFDICIQIINGAIKADKMEYLDIVISSLNTVAEPYKK